MRNNTVGSVCSRLLQHQDYINNIYVPKKKRGSNKTVPAEKVNFNAPRSQVCNYSSDPDYVPAVCKKNGEELINEKRTSKINRKRRYDKETKQAKETKKRRVPKKPDFAKLGLEPPPKLSQEVMDFIKQRGGSDVNLVIMKPLFKTDVEKHQDRLSIPVNQVRYKSFRTETEEQRLVAGDINVNLVEPVGLNVCKMKMRNWFTNSQYALPTSWIGVVDRNKDVLSVGSIVQVWSFRVNGELWLALVKVSNGVVDDNVNTEHKKS